MSWRTGLCVTALAAGLLLAPCRAAAQTDAAVRGRVVDDDGNPLAGVLVSASSSRLPGPMTTRTTPDGAYGLPSLPPGPYVIAFSLAGRATLKHQTRLSPTERRVLDATLIPEGRSEGAVVVEIDRESALERPQASRAAMHDTLERFPVIGGLLSAARWMPGAVSRHPFEALLLVDDTPLRSSWRLGARPSLLDAHEPLVAVTAAVGYLPAEYGRLQSGAIGAALRSGGDRFSGGFRTTLAGAGLDADVLDAAPTRGVTSGTEYRFGGPLRRDHTWFFLAARHHEQNTRERTAVTVAPYATDTGQALGSGKVTHAWAPNQRLEGMFVFDRQNVTGLPPEAAAIGGTEALEASRFTGWIGSLTYTASVGDRLWVTAGFSNETGSRTPAGTGTRDRLSLASLQDLPSGVRWWSPGTCVECARASRASRTWRATGSYLLSRGDRAHELRFGFEGSRDRHEPAGTPDEGRYELRVSGMRESGGGLVPVVRANGSSWVIWYPGGDPPFHIGSQSLFIEDHWQHGRHLTFDLGLRWDRFTTGIEGRQLLAEAAFSPRAALTWRLGPEREWTVMAGLARYVDRTGARRDTTPALVTVRGQRVHVYSGPEINVDAGTPVGPAEAVARVLSWFDDSGGVTRAPDFALAPGVTAMDGGESGTPAAVTELIAGVGRQLGWHSHARAEVFWRRYDGVPARTVAPGGSATDAFGRTIDAGTIARDERLRREHVGLSLQGRYRLGIIAAVGGHYTLSQARGTYDREGPLADPLQVAALGYPEYVDASWIAPEGSLRDDARHQLRLWGQANLFADDHTGSMSVTLLQHLESGHPYGVVGLIDVRPFAANPGYATPPIAVPYFFTDRDAFRTESAIRTDVAVNYTRPLPGTIYGEIFARFDLLNLFGHVRTRPALPHLVARTALTDPDRFEAFDPFGEAPVQGLHWDVDPRLGPDSGRVPETLPFAVRLTFGVRF